jgi:hypothetical protein
LFEFFEYKCSEFLNNVWVCRTLIHFKTVSNLARVKIIVVLIWLGSVEKMVMPVKGESRIV